MELVSHLFRVVLEWLGVDVKQQFLLMLLIGLALFLTYSLRYRADRVLGTIWALMSIAAVMFLASSSPRVRFGSLYLLAGLIIAAFVRYGYTMRQARASSRTRS